MPLHSLCIRTTTVDYRDGRRNTGATETEMLPIERKGEPQQPYEIAGTIGEIVQKSFRRQDDTNHYKNLG